MRTVFVPTGPRPPGRPPKITFVGEGCNLRFEHDERWAAATMGIVLEEDPFVRLAALLGLAIEDDES
jgi:hypothetical protein